MLFKDAAALNQALAGVLDVKANEVTVLDRAALQAKTIDALIYNAVFQTDEALKNQCRWLIREAAAGVGIVPASIQGLYEAMGRGETPAFTAPAVNIRALTYDVARAYFRAAKKTNVGAFLFEIAKSEIGYTEQRPGEYAACVLAAAVKEGHGGPVFIQGDHFQASAKNWAKDPQKELQGLKALIEDALGAGFFNIDIDTSTLVDLAFPTIHEQQAPNFTPCADLTAFIREKQPAGVEVSVGGEIGEVGGKNSTVDEFRAFMQGYLAELAKMKPGAKGISKMSVQTGTEHGGVPTADGKVADVKLDFNVLKTIGEVARKEFGLCGTVQHGASTLPDDLFDRFTQHNCGEIHLATGFQNMLYDHPRFPTALKDQMYRWMDEKCADEKKPGQTDAQFYYKTRKKALGPFKRQMWDLPAETRGAIMADVEAKFAFYMDKLKVAGTAAYVAKFVKPVHVASTSPLAGGQVKAVDMGFIKSDTGGE
jgi:fructose/tagatose bisphosphate aldolase